MRAARSRNSGGKRFDLLLMNSSYLSGRSVSTKPGAIQIAFYNQQRPDQALKMMTPDAAYAATLTA
ncbi:integrase core domain-containing protein (plasmid) [Gluconobacter oxydans H24]|nr:integrase core domain-containing protein [Gluconobacter oxydans H24]